MRRKQASIGGALKLRDGVTVFFQRADGLPRAVVRRDLTSFNQGSRRVEPTEHKHFTHTQLPEPNLLGAIGRGELWIHA